MMRSGEITNDSPRPPQASQAPNGELNENIFGVSSPMLMPCVLQA